MSSKSLLTLCLISGILLVTVLPTIRAIPSYNPVDDNTISEWEGVQNYSPGLRREFVTASGLLCPGVWVYDSVRRLDRTLDLPYVSTWVYIDSDGDTLRTITFSYDVELKGHLIQTQHHPNTLLESRPPYYFRHGPDFTQYMNETLDITVHWDSNTKNAPYDIGRRHTPNLYQEHLLDAYMIQMKDMRDTKDMKEHRGITFLPSKPALLYE
jgi:hypothetical protein